MLPVNRNPTQSDLRKFGLTILLGLGLIGGLLWYVGRAPVDQPGLSGTRLAALALWAAGLAVAVLTVPPTALGRPVYVGWMTAAMAIGLVVTPVLFTLLFFTVLPLFALIRLRDPLRVRGAGLPTYWEAASPHEATLERTRRPF